MKNNDIGSRDLDFGLAAEVAVSESVLELESARSSTPFGRGRTPEGNDRGRPSEPTESGAPDLGDLVIVLLASTLAGLRDRLEGDGFERASVVVAELTERCDDYHSGVTS